MDSQFSSRDTFPEGWQSERTELSRRGFNSMLINSPASISQGSRVISLRHIRWCGIVVFIRAIRCIRVPVHDVLIAASAARTNAFYRVSPFRILACCCFYFPTTMVLMYCYGSAFHVNKLRLKRVVCVNTPEVVSGGHIERVSQAYLFRICAISSVVRKLMSRRNGLAIDKLLLNSYRDRRDAHRDIGTLQIRHHCIRYS